MKSTIGILVCLLAASASNSFAQLAAAGKPTAKIANDKRSWRMPFELVDNRIFINVQLNGRGPFKFILDTGGYASISFETANKLRLDLGAEVQGRGAGENVVTARETVIGDTQIGQFRIKNQDFRVFDFSDSRHVFGKKRFDGIIGLPVFENLVVKVDYENRIIHYAAPAKCNSKVPRQAVPFTVDRYLPLIRGEIDGIEGIFGIDTGDRSTLTLKGPFVKEHRLSERYSPLIEALTGWGIGGPIRAQVVRTGKFAFGDIELRGLVTRLSLQRSAAFAASDAAGNLGAGFLKQFSVTFDYVCRRVSFETNSNFGHPDLYDRSGMWISLSADGRSFEITDVVSKGPAAMAGLQVGDKILAIDGRKTVVLALVDWRQRLKDPLRHRVRFLVKSGLKLRTITLWLRDLM